MPPSSLARLLSQLLSQLLSRLYPILLYAYPREFRLEYGEEMSRVFRDQCRDLARANDHSRMIRFAVLSAADWTTTTVRERFDSVKSALSAARKTPQRGFTAEWTVSILMYLFASTTLVQAYVIPTGSMEGTLRVGDHLLVDRSVYADPGAFGRHIMPYRGVQRGDIIVFLAPEDVRQTLVKRVIGLPGDHIRLVDKQVIRNGQHLNEPYTQHISPATDLYRDYFPEPPDAMTSARGLDMLAHHVMNGEVIVPPGSLFAMGDNRDNSLDSRYWGFVPREYVLGKPLIVYWSYDAPTADLEEWNTAHVFDLMQHFFSRTRWERTLLVPRSESAR
jgi:signal peptidase I